MPKPAVLHIDCGKSFRGGQRQLLLLYQHLQKNDITQVVATPRDGALLEKLDSEATIALSGVSLFRKLFIGPLYESVKKYEMNILHAHDSEAHTIGIRLKRKIPHLKLIVSRRVIFRPSSKVSIQNKYLKHADYYIAISAAVKKTLLEIGVPENLISVIPSGVEIEQIERTAPDDRRINGIREKFDFIIATAGALTDEKDFFTAIDAVQIAAKAKKNIALVVLGDGPLKSRLEKHAASAGAENIFFMGHVEPLAAIFKACDMFLLTSKSEGLNSSAIEAAACGLPLVVSAVGGLPEIAELNYNGLLCQAGDAGGFAAAIIELAGDRTLQATMGQNSRARARSFSIGQTAEETVRVYNNLLAG